MELTMKSQYLKDHQIHAKTLLSGIVTGQIAGAIMAVAVMLVFALFLGTNFLYPVQVIASVFMGESALLGINIWAVLLGVILHQLGPSLVWGTLYGIVASLLNIKTTQQALALGLGLGIVSMVGPYFIIPNIMNAFQGTDYWNREVPILWDWAAHLIFGASFALFPKVASKIETE